uniref:Uncharacterized protein n=1 Tax=Amphimedon queenslandica TaxID=400682 RepID=A0A1X7TD83_AMPQE
MEAKATLTGSFLPVLGCLLLFRTVITIHSELDKTVCELQVILFESFPIPCHGEIKYSDVACVVIWISMTLISMSLIWDIITKGLSRSAFKGFHKILSLLSIISYEIWMFDYIYNTYVTNFNWTFTIMIFLPLVTLLVHSIFQNFLSYDEYVLPKNKAKTRDLVCYIVASLGFNGIMIVHVVCMFLTALSTGISKENNFIYIVNVAFLGLGEMMNRAYVMKNHFEQLINQYIPYKMYMKTAMEHHMQEMRNNVHTPAELETRYVNLDVELVTGLSQKREKETSYLTVPIVATFAVATLSAFVAGNI